MIKTKISFLKNLLSVIILTGLIIILYISIARPYQLHWGAEKGEITRSMPGDEVNTNPMFSATRAITINGSPGQIFPWLLQMGYERAGFYGYDIIENIGSRNGIESADHIIEKYQNFKVGDIVPISSVARMRFYSIKPNQYLIWTGESKEYPGSFLWALYPIDKNHTRLISRIRWSHHWTNPGLLPLDLFTEFTDHIAVRKILQGIKGRVEGHIEPMFLTNIEFFIYVIALLLFITTLTLILIYGFSWLRWFTGLIIGITWLIIWYSEAPFWVGAAIEILIVLLIYQIYLAKIPKES